LLIGAVHADAQAHLRDVPLLARQLEPGVEVEFRLERVWSVRGGGQLVLEAREREVLGIRQQAEGQQDVGVLQRVDRFAAKPRIEGERGSENSGARETEADEPDLQLRRLVLPQLELERGGLLLFPFPE